MRPEERQQTVVPSLSSDAFRVQRQAAPEERLGANIMAGEKMKKQRKDACYYKVKARFKVFPSAYASGALVQCRKKGAGKWGVK